MFDVCLRRVRIAHENSAISAKLPTLVAVSKRQPEQRIREALVLGQRHFGENKVQEAFSHWQERKRTYPDITLHLIGPLQSNKVKEAVQLFDMIHTIDREKIARAVKEEMNRQGRSLPCLIQVNTGEEPQKAGIWPKELADFIAYCRDIDLDIKGLMCIPPVNTPASPHFALLHQLAQKYGLSELSMGMSNDFEEAIRFGATYVRLGTTYFGERESN